MCIRDRCTVSCMFRHFTSRFMMSLHLMRSSWLQDDAGAGSGKPPPGRDRQVSAGDDDGTLRSLLDRDDQVDEPADPWIGVVLDERYRILERLAQGSMGAVYRGERVPLGRPVAIKILH